MRHRAMTSPITAMPTPKTIVSVIGTVAGVKTCVALLVHERLRSQWTEL